MRLICLLAARNCEHLLPGYFQSVERFADAVVAIDDGSRDGTRSVLARQPLVEVLLENPPRRGCESDEGSNRNRLLEAAAGLDPDWVILIEADERVPAADAVALRRFVETQALPGCAFGLERLGIVDDPGSPSREWVYRLFAFRPGQRFPVESGCFEPVPTSVPPHTWVKTTFRLVHLPSSSHPELLSARLTRPPELPPLSDQPASPYAAAISLGQVAIDSTVRLEIDRHEFALRLYRGLRLQKSYPITVGLPDTPTPPGVFEISSALYNPSWIRPRGGRTGQIVPPDDEQNPIREHWLGLADGVGIHGTRWTRALRSPISLGCIGMSPRDIVDLYPHVQLGTPIVVL